MNNFKAQLFALVSGLILMFIIIIFLIFMGIDRTRKDLIQVNKIYLAQITLKLDLTLWEDSFSSILEKNLFSKYEKAKKVGFLTVYFIKLLEGEFTDFPGVDFGYYDRELETILGCPPPLGPPLPQENKDNESTWTSIETGLKAEAVKKFSEKITMGEEDIFISEKLGNKFFLFYIHPLVRQGNLIGTTWAIMEFRDFYEPFMANIQISLIVMIAGILAALAVGNNLRKGFDYIQDGLQNLRVDLGYRFDRRGGEIGEISNAINELASSITRVRSYTELILEGTGEGVIALDKDSKVVFFNKAAGLLLNISRENVIVKDYREIFSDEHDLLRETIEDALKGKNRNILKTIYKLNNGQEIFLSVNSFSLGTSDREGAVMILRDLSDMERLERKLRQTDKLAALGKLVAGVAHEIRNPIASIRANVQLWEKRLEKTPPSKEALDMVIDEIDRLNGIVEKWLIFARYRTSSREKYDINDVIKRAVELMRVEIKNRDVDFFCETEENIPSVYINPQEIEQVIINLIQNSLDMLSDGGSLTVRSNYIEESSRIKVEIVDTGPGVPLEIQGKIFDPFFTTKEEGTGLGLAVCYDIITGHKGNIDFETRLGKGSTFYFTLPAGIESVGHTEVRSEK